MLKEKEVIVRRGMMALDAGVISAAFLLAYVLRSSFHALYKYDLFHSARLVSDSLGRFNDHLLLLLLAAPLWCLLLYKNGMYESWRTRQLYQIIWIVGKASLAAFLIFGAAFFLLKLEFISRLFFVGFAFFGLVFLAVEKTVVFLFLHRIRKKGYNYRSVLIVGTGRRAAEFVKKIAAHPEWGYQVAGAIDDEPGRGLERVDGVRIIGGLEAIPRLLPELGIDEVVFVVPRLRLNHIEGSVRACELQGVKVRIAVDLFDLRIATAYQDELDGVPLLTFKTTVPSEWDLLVKRAIDISFSGVALFLSSPLFLMIAILVKATSKGPVFFRQERVGLNGKRFVLYKFRTMHPGAQQELAGVDIYKEIYEPEWKAKKLRHVTPVGRILRKFSLDELPQLINVFSGNMSLVGPRPTLPEETAQYEAWHRRRFSMRPGLTCLWQVQGRREIKFNEWMQQDLEYLDNWSLWLDFKILAKTIPAVLFGSGAY